MTSPYQPPKAPVIESAASPWPYRNCIVAILSGAVVFPVAVFIFFKIMFGDAADGLGNKLLWSSVGIGSLLAGVIGYLFKRMSVWASAALGPLVVMIFIVLLAVLKYEGAA